MYERLIGLCNDVGLLSEEFDPQEGRFLGNFPQAMSHVALVNTASNLSGTSARRGAVAGSPTAAPHQASHAERIIAASQAPRWPARPGT